MTEAFVDANVLVYAAVPAQSAAKSSLAHELLARTEFGISGQVAAEFANVLGRKLKASVDARVLPDWLDLLGTVPCVPVTLPLVRAGVVIAERYRLSYFDSAIIAAAHELGARTLYSEDLSHGQRYGEVVVHNPFQTA
jgi:predicted nucleic acid-binding protein